MKFCDKKNLFSVLFLICALPFFALPGFDPEVKDISGQFVFYQDYTFERESYIGIVGYDEGTYGVRYFAPETGKNESFKPRKDIQILFTLDPSKDHVDLTGERVITAVTPDDTDLINYMHDFLYEMNLRRVKAGIFSKKIKINQEYEQFGGNVTLEYNYLIPFFNLEKIVDLNGKVVLKIVTAGQLKDSYDTSFADFDGFFAGGKGTEKNNTFKLEKKSKKKTVEFNVDENQKLSVNIDSQWNVQAENFYILEKGAVLAMSGMKLTDGQVDQILRRFLLGAEQSYPDWTKLSFVESDGRYVIKQIFYDVVSKKYTVDFKIFSLSGDGRQSLLTMTVYEEAYAANKKYFDAIVNSFKVF